MIRQEIRFVGNVQGVGFRYTAKYAARALGLTGWVYNDYDGSVLMEVQGNPEIIESLIFKIEQRPFIIIENIEKKNIPLIKNEGEFYIKDSF